jgi:hypothetical protein
MKRLILLLLISYSCFSQNYTYFAGSRSSSLAHSSVSLVDIWSSFHNQASLAFIEADQIGISYQNRFGLKDLSTASLAYLKSYPFGNLGINISAFGFEQFNQSKMALNFSRKFGESLSMGAQANIENQFIEEKGNQSIFTWEFGILSKPIKKVQVGIHVYNPMNSNWESEIDINTNLGLRFGANYSLNPETLICAEIQKWADWPETYSLGFEYSFFQYLLLRCGFAFPDNSQHFGLGLKLKKLQIDQALEYSSFLGSSLSLSLNYEI